MVLDGVLLAIVVVFGIYGYRKGFVSQAVGLAGLVVVVLFGAPLADIVERVLANEFSIVLPGRHFRLLLVSCVCAVLYLLCSLVGHFLHQTLVRGIKLAEKTNHVVGAALGIVESLVGIYFVLGLASIGEGKIREYAPEVADVLVSSVTYRAVCENNVVDEFGIFLKDRGAVLEKKSSKVRSEAGGAEVEKEEAVAEEGGAVLEGDGNVERGEPVVMGQGAVRGEE